MDHPEIINVGIFIFDGYSDWEIAFLTPELHKDKGLSLTFFSLDGEAVVSAGGLQVTPQASIRELESDELSVLILPGGTAWENESFEGLSHLVDAMHNASKIIAAICAATSYLGQRGILDSVKHTSNALEYIQYAAPRYDGADNYLPDASVLSNNIITANGISPIEFSRDIFEAIGTKSSSDIEKWFQLFKNGVWVG